MASTFDSAKNHPAFQSVLDSLVINQFCLEYNLPNHRKEIDEENLVKACWLASVLANSNEEKHQFQAASFAKLLYLQNSNHEVKSRVAYTILSRTGNLVATNHLTSLYDQNPEVANRKFKSNFGTALDLELGTKRNINKLTLQNKTTLVTDFQKKLWEALQQHDHVAISAPTSAGKSFFVQNFIQNSFHTHSELSVIYIVPSRALISQASDEFKKLLSNQDVSVKTAFVESEHAEGSTVESVLPKRVIFCITAERCLKLLQQGWKQKFRPDLIFIDEIQNVETDDNRAVLLEYVLGEFNKIWAGAKIIFAGPFINNGKELYKKLLSIPAEEISTYLPPVYQLRLTLQVQKGNQIAVLIHLRDNRVHEIKLNNNIPITGTGNKSILAPIVELFGKRDGNLIYAAKTNWCVSYAMEFIKVLHAKNGLPDTKDLDSRIRDLMDLLKEDIHPEYALIYCLKYKVAFHHGKLPDMIKNEIESLFKDGLIEYLFCTSTLLQGVNLPAPRMFIISATKESKDLSHFEFGNLIGRAGRINNSMTGTIFCLERNPAEKPWSSSYYNSEYIRDVIPTSEKVLRRDTGEVINVVSRLPKDLKHSGDEYTVNLIKQKFIENPESVTAYLSARGVDAENNSILSAIETQLKDIKVTNEIVRLNPMIDPVLQNQLYNQIIEDGIEKWVLFDEDTGNQIFNRMMLRENVKSLAYQDQPMYYQLESLTERLDKIFAMWKEAFMKRSSVKSTKQMNFHAMNWINGHSMAYLVEKQLEYHAESLKDLKGEARIIGINDHINQVITVNSTIVTFILVKYFKLLADLLDGLMTENQKVKFRKTLLIPTMLELGSRKVDVIVMISMGIPRSIALKLSRFVPEAYKTNPIGWLHQIEKIEELPIKHFYWRYLWRKGYLPALKFKGVSAGKAERAG